MSAEFIGGIANPPESGVVITTPRPQVEFGQLIELPRVDPMKLTRDEWLNLSLDTQRNALFELRRKSYDPTKEEQSKRLFPEGYTYPLTEVEHIVFDSAGRVMESENGSVSEQDRTTLARYLHFENISVDEAIAQFQEEGAHRREGNFWPLRHSIGGFELNRQIASNIERDVAQDIRTDEVRLGYFREMAISLEGLGIPMKDADQKELERLEADKEERDRFINQKWEQARRTGASSTRIH